MMRVFEGANGWYIAQENANGFHHQPDTWDTAAWYPTRATAEAAMRTRPDYDDGQGRRQTEDEYLHRYRSR